MCVYIHIYTYMYISLYIYTYIRICLYTYMNIYVSIDVCIYVYIYVYKRTFTCTHTNRNTITLSHTHLRTQTHACTHSLAQRLTCRSLPMCFKIKISGKTPKFVAPTPLQVCPIYILRVWGLRLMFKDLRFGRVTLEFRKAKFVAPTGVLCVEGMVQC